MKPPYSDLIAEQKMRRQQDRDDLMRIGRIEIQLKSATDDLLEIQKRAERYNECMQIIKDDIKDIKNTQDKFYPIMEGIDTIVKAGRVTKFIFGTIIVVMGVVATVLSIIDYYRKM
jgi:hypothetical protein